MNLNKYNEFITQCTISIIKRSQKYKISSKNGNLNSHILPTGATKLEITNPARIYRVARTFDFFSRNLLFVLQCFDFVKVVISTKGYDNKNQDSQFRNWLPDPVSKIIRTSDVFWVFQTYLPKAQLISKCLLGVIVSTKRHFEIN